VIIPLVFIAAAGAAGIAAVLALWWHCRPVVTEYEVVAVYRGWPSTF
jgi:hypothetical protein